MTMYDHLDRDSLVERMVQIREQRQQHLDQIAALLVEQAVIVELVLRIPYERSVPNIT